jgi:DNA helicase-2/ATP-dependent DNA helicase PcrA
MTLHLAKGLEYPLVFLTGLEEGLLPHYRSIDDPIAIEEERRLCYVGITRAMQKLYLSRATLRGLFAAGGSSGYREVSRFAYDMPAECLEHLNGDFARALGFLAPDTKSEDDEEIGFGGGKAARFTYAAGARAHTSRPKPTRRGTGFAGVKTADALLSEAVTRAPLGPPATPEQLAPGTKVAHPTFGVGTIQTVEADATNDPLKMKIAVKFDALEEPKKFIFKFAKLELVQ